MATTPLDVTQISVGLYQRKHRGAIRDLLTRSDQSHIHLDWQETESWLEEATRVGALVRLAWLRGHLVGVLASSEPLAGAVWIRLAGVEDRYDPAAILPLLWGSLRQELRATGVRQVAFLMVRQWTEHYAAMLGFVPIEQIITLRRDNSRMPDAIEMPALHLRPAYGDDLPAIIATDHDAFDPPWQMSRNDIRQAIAVASICRVATVERQIVAYQISTLYFDGAHLARLAVARAWQGHGVGSALVGDAIRHYGRRNVFGMTVNTQATNHASRRVYERFGFLPNDFDLPVWSLNF